MIRTVGLLGSIALLAACSGDGRGSQYSSARAQTGAVSYVPITPGAQPVSMQGGQVLTGPIAVTPGAVPLDPAGARPAPVTTAVLTPAPAPVPAVRFATGPIYSACLDAGRNGATQSRCGCVQWVADQQLTAAQQRRGAGYFNSQQDLQEIRQSDSRGDDEFWAAWKAFGASAGDICRGT